MTLPELAEATGLSKSSVQRFTHTLWTLGYLRKDPASKKFSLGPWSLELGMKYVQTSPLVLGGNPFLHSLNRNCQETCSLAEPDGLDMVYVARFATHKEMFVNMPVGMRLPLYCTAAGRAVLSRLDPDVAHWLLERSDRRSHTAATITGMDALLAELEFARRHGYARSMASSTRATSPSPPCWMPAASPGRGQCVGSIQPLVVRTGAGRVWSAGGRNRACHQRVAHLGTFLSLLRAGASRRRARATPISVAGEA